MHLTRVAIQRPVTVLMAVTAVALFGYVSLQRLPLNLLPRISYPSLTIQTDYQDAAPEEIEALLTRRVEESVGVVGGLTRITSVSRPGQSEVVLEFNWNTNMDQAGVEVREKLDLIEFPEDAERPVILRFDPSNDPILRIQVHGELSMARLRDIAERDLSKRVESVDGVAAVKVAGGREEQIRVELDERRVAELGLSITRVTQILREENLNQASGSLYDLDMNYMVRMVNEFRSVDEVRGIVVSDQDGRKILLEDIAHVWRGSKERDVIARFNGRESVELAVYKEGDANTVIVSEAVQARLEAVQKEPTFPPGVETSVVYDQSRFISSSVDNVLWAALVGGLLATLVLFLFLRDARSTAIIAAAIPISVMATFAAMYQAGITLNIMSLGGVALGVGMLVDSSIVVLEAVHRHRRPGVATAEAVAAGTEEVAMPVTASTLTTVAVFLPLVFVEGIAGQLFRDQALTITFALFASLAVALTVIPTLLAARLRSDREMGVEPGERAVPGVQRFPRWLVQAARFASREAPRIIVQDARKALSLSSEKVLWGLTPLLGAFDRAFTAVEGRYDRALERALESKGAVMAIVAGAVVAALALFQVLGAELIPTLAQGQFSFQVSLPEGRPLESTDRLMQQVEGRVLSVPGVETVYSSVGGSLENQFASGDLEEHVGTLHVVLRDREDDRLENEVIQSVRRIIAEVPEAQPRFQRPALFSFKTPVEVEVFAYEIEDQRDAAALVAERLGRIDGLRDIETTTRAGNPEVQVRFDRRRLSRLGLQEEQVARVLRNKIRGDVASRYREGDRQIEILVQVDEPDRNAISDIRSMVVNSRPGQASSPDARGRSPQTGVPAARPVADRDEDARRDRDRSEIARPFVPIRLDQVAEIEVHSGPAEIRRIRSQRAAVVTANLSGRDVASVSNEIRAMLADIRGELPQAATAGIGGQNEELEVSFRSLMFALGLAVFLVYLVMASQFESLLHPFIILLTVPLGLVGVVFLLAFTGLTLSVVVLLGAVILAGIAVNNGIVLVDYTNRLRQAGLAKREALLRAGRVRLRPILMTTLTTLLGLVPMAFGWGEGDEVRTPMAVAVIGGLLTSTPFTLLVIPVVYEIVDRKSFSAAPERTSIGRASERSMPSAGGLARS
ncbi:MAG: efflux RND transporter permease subunit [Bryobacterales bacterium]|nr:efflux RND transporter permease subunit [Bryobacterales bacterium]